MRTIKAYIFCAYLILCLLGMELIDIAVTLLVCLVSVIEMILYYPFRWFLGIDLRENSFAAHLHDKFDGMFI